MIVSDINFRNEDLIPLIVTPTLNSCKYKFSFLVQTWIIFILGREETHYSDISSEKEIEPIFAEITHTLKLINRDTFSLWRNTGLYRNETILKTGIFCYKGFLLEIVINVFRILSLTCFNNVKCVSPDVWFVSIH